MIDLDAVDAIAAHLQSLPELARVTVRACEAVAVDTADIPAGGLVHVQKADGVTWQRDGSSDQETVEVRIVHQVPLHCDQHDQDGIDEIRALDRRSDIIRRAVLQHDFEISDPADGGRPTTLRPVDAQSTGNPSHPFLLHQIYLSDLIVTFDAIRNNFAGRAVIRLREAA